MVVAVEDGWVKLGSNIRSTPRRQASQRMCCSSISIRFRVINVGGQWSIGFLRVGEWMVVPFVFDD